MVGNSKLYYKKGSSEYSDACLLEGLVTRTIDSVLAGEDPNQTIGDREEMSDLTEFLEELFGAVMTANDPGDSNRQLNTVFQLLPSRKRYPEYFEVINDPMDLKMIAEKIQKNSYKELADLEKDLQLIFTNARTFNEPGSQIYKDAGILSKVVKSKAADCVAGLTARQARGSRSSRRVSRQVFSANVANLQYESDSDDMDEDADDHDEMRNDPFWRLYNGVKSFKTERGVDISEVFVSLPSKRELPDYYQTISNPISLNMIKKKIKNGDYSTLQNLAEDFELMFNNCKTYNRQESKLWKDAHKLQGVMTKKLQEIVDGVPPEEPLPDRTGSPKEAKDSVKKRLKVLFNSIFTWANSEGIQPIGEFNIE